MPRVISILKIQEHDRNANNLKWELDEAALPRPLPVHFSKLRGAHNSVENYGGTSSSSRRGGGSSDNTAPFRHETSLSVRNPTLTSMSRTILLDTRYTCCPTILGEASDLTPLLYPAPTMSSPSSARNHGSPPTSRPSSCPSNSTSSTCAITSGTFTTSK